MPVTGNCKYLLRFLQNRRSEGINYLLNSTQKTPKLGNRDTHSPLCDTTTSTHTGAPTALVKVTYAWCMSTEAILSILDPPLSKNSYQRPAGGVCSAALGSTHQLWGKRPCAPCFWGICDQPKRGVDKSAVTGAGRGHLSVWVTIGLRRVTINDTFSVVFSTWSNKNLL